MINGRKDYRQFFNQVNDASRQPSTLGLLPVRPRTTIVSLLRAAGSALPGALLLAALLPVLAARADVPDNAVWIDVRTPGEYARGHLEGASLIPFDGIEVGVARLALPKDIPIYLYCAAGGRSEAARQRLQGQGYSAVVNAGGLEQARLLASGGTH